MHLSIATNAVAGDAMRLRQMVPSWQRTFGDVIREIVIVVDELPASGRIASLHGTGGTLSELWAEIDALRAKDSRIRGTALASDAELKAVARRWFGRDLPLRCQGGTPILAFVAAIEAASQDLVLRTDCDMLFYDRGWLRNGVEQLDAGEVDLFEPPRLGGDRIPASVVSTRTFVVSKSMLESSCLPLRPHRLDPLRRIHRRHSGRESWLALEQMFSKEKARGHIRHEIRPLSEGHSLHVAARGDAGIPGFGTIVSRFESGHLPVAQRDVWDFLPDAWQI